MRNLLKGAVVLLAVLTVYLVTAQNNTIKSNNTSVIEKYEYAKLTSQKEWSYDGKNSVTKVWVEFKSKDGNNIYKADADNVANLKNAIGALNYLGNEGWDLVSVYINEGEQWREDIHILKRKK